MRSGASVLADPLTVRAVKPEEFDRTFGPNVHWRGIQIEMTKEAITRDIDKRLPWIVKLVSGPNGKGEIGTPSRSPSTLHTLESKRDGYDYLRRPVLLNPFDGRL
jgi:hypothetical protein